MYFILKCYWKCENAAEVQMPDFENEEFCFQENRGNAEGILRNQFDQPTYFGRISCKKDLTL